MGEAFITRRGGNAKAFAVIGVTYPAGYVCTCSDGIKTLKLKDTGGQGFFLIPYAGVWTVTATDGTNTKAQSVEITSEGQSESVALNYAVDIFNGGATVPFTARNAKNATVAIGDTLLFQGNGEAYDKGALAYTTNKINITDYNSIVFEGSFTQVIDSNADRSRAGIMEAAAQSQQNWIASTILDTTNNSWTLDISSITGSYHICVFAGNGYLDYLKGDITRIYLM